MIPADVAARAGTRLHALDAIRASALLLGICLHASLSLVPTRGLAFWPVSDVQQSTALTVAGFVIHIFRMSVFFLVAGLLARALVESRGVVAFLRNRAARVLVPLVLGWVLCFALLVGVGLWLLAKANNGELPSPLPTAMLDAGLNFLHLWFLYLLLWLYAISLAMRSALLCIDKSGSVSRMLDATVGKGERRLKVTESLMLDPRRRLVLVRLDGREHLLLLSPSRDLVVSDVEAKEIVSVEAQP